MWFISLLLIWSVDALICYWTVHSIQPDFYCLMYRLPLFTILVGVLIISLVIPELASIFPFFREQWLPISLSSTIAPSLIALLIYSIFQQLHVWVFPYFSFPFPCWSWQASVFIFIVAVLFCFILPAIVSPVSIFPAVSVISSWLFYPRCLFSSSILSHLEFFTLLTSASFCLFIFPVLLLRSWWWSTFWVLIQFLCCFCLSIYWKVNPLCYLFTCLFSVVFTVAPSLSSWAFWLFYPLLSVRLGYFKTSSSSQVKVTFLGESSSFHIFPLPADQIISLAKSYSLLSAWLASLIIQSLQFHYLMNGY